MTLYSPGMYYVARVRPNLHTGDTMKLESMAFDPNREPEPGYALKRARDWRDHIQKQWPKHEVIVVQVMENDA
jgi:hypothetical protein